MPLDRNGVQVGAHLIGPNQKAPVIAEVGVNHNGDVVMAHDMVDRAADAGADFVKFQTFDPAALVSNDAEAAPYQRRHGSTRQLDMLSSLTLPRSAWGELRDHCRERGVEFLSTPFDTRSALLLVGIGACALKVPSGELTNTPFVREVASLGLPLFISTGMGSRSEVDRAIAAADAAPGVVLFHCVSAYPAPVEDCNLRAIPAMEREHGLPVGWSDHTRGHTTAVAAVALGARVLEKHFTLDRTLPGPDHAASLEPGELMQYIAAARQAESALGDGRKRRMPSEEENAGLARRSWHAARDLAEGHVLTDGDLVTLRPEVGLLPHESVHGRRLARAVVAGQPLTIDALVGD